LKKNKNLSAQLKLSAVDKQSFTNDFRKQRNFRFEKASKIHDKVEQEIQQRDLEIQICNYGSCFFAARKCACR
jgi:hypothetical protein